MSHHVNARKLRRDKKPKIVVDQFRLTKIVDQQVHRSLLLPKGNQGAQQLIVNGCLRSLMTVSDGFSDSVFIDDCTECKIILSPVKGRSQVHQSNTFEIQYIFIYIMFSFRSVFLRNCRDCFIVIAACGQFRTRDCTNITTYLHCASQPSIETSVRLKFNCVSIDYPNFRGNSVIGVIL